MWCNSFSQSVTWASSCDNFHIFKHLGTCRPLLVLKQSCTAAEGLEPVTSKVSFATAQHLHKYLGSQQVKTMPKSASISHSWSVCLSKHSDPAITLFRYKTIEKKHSSANISVLVSLQYKLWLLSPSLENQSTASLLLWRDGWRLHVLLLPSQCLQRTWVGMGTWKRNNKWTKWTVLGTMTTKHKMCVEVSVLHVQWRCC